MEDMNLTEVVENNAAVEIPAVEAVPTESSGKGAGNVLGAVLGVGVVIGAYEGVKFLVKKGVKAVKKLIKKKDADANGDDTACEEYYAEEADVD